MGKLFNLIAVLIFVFVAFVLGVVLYGSTKSVKFKKHASAPVISTSATLVS